LLTLWLWQVTGRVGSWAQAASSAAALILADRNHRRAFIGELADMPARSALLEPVSFKADMPGRALALPRA
jgi:hypothetical protein